MGAPNFNAFAHAVDALRGNRARPNLAALARADLAQPVARPDVPAPIEQPVAPVLNRARAPEQRRGRTVADDVAKEASHGAKMDVDALADEQKKRAAPVGVDTNPRPPKQQKRGGTKKRKAPEPPRGDPPLPEGKQPPQPPPVEGKAPDGGVEYPSLRLIPDPDNPGMFRVLIDGRDGGSPSHLRPDIRSRYSSTVVDWIRRTIGSGSSPARPGPAGTHDEL